MKKYKKRLTDDEVLFLLSCGLKIKQLNIAGVSFRRVKKLANKNNIFLQKLEEDLRMCNFIKILQDLVNESEFKLEHNLQVIVLRKIKELKPNWIVFSVPNGGKRNKFEVLGLKSEGQLDGVSDLIVLGEFPTAYFIEMKASGGKVSEAQEKI